MELKTNNENDECARCNEGKGEIPLSSNKGTSWICEYCDNDLFGINQEDIITTTFILQEIDKQIRHHKAEKNNEAISSLNYIKTILRGVE
jgi:hypothetical protein